MLNKLSFIFITVFLKGILFHNKIWQYILFQKHLWYSFDPTTNNQNSKNYSKYLNKHFQYYKNNSTGTWSNIQVIQLGVWANRAIVKNSNQSDWQLIEAIKFYSILLTSIWSCWLLISLTFKAVSVDSLVSLTGSTTKKMTKQYINISTKVKSLNILKYSLVTKLWNATFK